MAFYKQVILAVLSMVVFVGGGLYMTSAKAQSPDELELVSPAKASETTGKKKEKAKKTAQGTSSVPSPAPSPNPGNVAPQQPQGNAGEPSADTAIVPIDGQGATTTPGRGDAASSSPGATPALPPEPVAPVTPKAPASPPRQVAPTTAKPRSTTTSKAAPPKTTAPSRPRAPATTVPPRNNLGDPTGGLIQDIFDRFFRF